MHKRKYKRIKIVTTNSPINTQKDNKGANEEQKQYMIYANGRSPSLSVFTLNVTNLNKYKKSNTE